MNIKRAQDLIERGLMKPAGAAAFAQRDEAKANRYSFEREHVEFSAQQLKQLKANQRAWKFFQAQPPSYRKTVTWWVISGKQEATQARRLARLIEDSAAGQRIAAMRSTPNNK